MSCAIVVYISYNMGTWDLPDMCSYMPAALGPVVLGI